MKNKELLKDILIRVAVGLLLLALCVASVFGYLNTKVNYSLIDYLPENTNTVKGYEIIQEEFGSVSYARVMVENIDIVTAWKLKRQISGYSEVVNEETVEVAGIEGVQMVLWLDSMVEMVVSLLQDELAPSDSELSEWLNDIPIETDSAELQDFIELIRGDEPLENILDFIDENPIILKAIDVVIDYYFDGAINLSTYYDSKEKVALIEVYFTESDYSALTSKAIDEIKDVFKDKTAYYDGTAISTKAAQETTSSEVVSVLFLVVPLAILILILATSSYAEPLVLLLVIGLSLVFNMGTNIIFEWLGLLDGISFMTNSMMMALQMAISLDYGIFILHKYREERDAGFDIKDANKRAIKQSVLPVASSCLTTVAGFIAISFMSFGLGKDLGFVFAKAIIISFLVAMCCMPYFTSLFDKLIKKTRHKPLMPNGTKLTKLCVRFGVAIIVLVLVCGAGSFMLQDNLSFVYGESAIAASEGTQTYDDLMAIRNTFGVYNPLVVIVPTELRSRSPNREAEILEQIREMTVSTSNVTNKRIVTSIMSFGSLNNENMASLMPEGMLSQLSTQFDSADGKYTRIVVNINADTESEEAFAAYTKIQSILSPYENCYITGSTVAAYEMKSIIESDYDTVNMIAIVAVGVIVMFAFKSLILPVLLVGTIEMGIFVNMGIASLMGTTIAFLGYLIVSLIQLGATIDYAILYTQNYINNRKTKNKNVATLDAVRQSIVSILTSSGILCVAGLAIGFSSSVQGVADIGMMIGRGALISAVLVLFFLPPLLRLCDRYIPKLSLKMKFLMPQKQLSEEALSLQEIEKHLEERKQANQITVEESKDTVDFLIDAVKTDESAENAEKENEPTQDAVEEDGKQDEPLSRQEEKSNLTVNVNDNKETEAKEKAKSAKSKYDKRMNAKKRRKR